MAVETSAATGALIKFFGVPVLTGAAATALGFLFMWPKTAKEAMVRIASTIVFSAVLGPALVVALHSTNPALFEAARAVAVLYGAAPEQGFLFLASPLMVLAGLPAWWIVGAIVRWLDKRKDKDIGELVVDARQLVHQVKGDA